MTVLTELPEWAQRLVDWVADGAEEPLDFQGTEVPMPVQNMLLAGLKPQQTLEEMQDEILAVNQANGWFDDGRSFGDDIALLHSEASEMYEAYRDDALEDTTGRGCLTTPDGTHLHEGPCKPEGVGSEAADVLIRLLDTCERHNLDLRAEYERKISYNRTRGYKHGGKIV